MNEQAAPDIVNEGNKNHFQPQVWQIQRRPSSIQQQGLANFAEFVPKEMMPCHKVHQLLQAGEGALVEDSLPGVFQTSVTVFWSILSDEMQFLLAQLHEKLCIPTSLGHIDTCVIMQRASQPGPAVPVPKAVPLPAGMIEKRRQANPREGPGSGGDSTEFG